MIDLAERCVAALKEHAQPAFTAQLAGLSPEERTLIQDDRTRYFEEVERELVKVLRPTQSLIDGLEARGHRMDGELEVVCWCQLEPGGAHTDLCQFLFHRFADFVRA